VSQDFFGEGLRLKAQGGHIHSDNQEPFQLLHLAQKAAKKMPTPASAGHNKMDSQQGVDIAQHRKSDPLYSFPAFQDSDPNCPIGRVPYVLPHYRC
jgi:hypothetical protein